MKLDEIVGDASHLTAERIETYVYNNFYVYDDEPENITIEDEKDKFFIRYRDGYLDVWADDPIYKDRAHKIKQRILQYA